MLSKIYLLLVVVFGGVFCAVSFYAYSWLGSIGDPTIVAAEYISQSSLGWTYLWVTFLILIGFGGFILLKTGSKWPFWTAYGYFVLAIALLLFNDSAYGSFLAMNSMEPTYSLLNPFFVAVVLLVILIAVIAAQFVVLKMRVVMPSKRDSNKDGNEEK